VSVPGEHEVLLSDRLLDALGIEIVRAGDGLWRFHKEPSSVSGRAPRPGSGSDANLGQWTRPRANP